MNEKTKLYSIFLLCIFLTTFFIGYSIGYQRGEKHITDCISDTINEEPIYESIYDEPWWNTNWTKIIMDNNTYIYYTENCTENQINEFIEENSIYEEFDNCYIWRYE